MASMTAAQKALHQQRRETLNPFVAKAPVQIDVWVLPWTNRADLMLQLQLAYMLSRDEFWTKHSFLRVCSVVGPFSELGGDADADAVTVGSRRAELYDDVWWKMRIPATIEVFDAKEVVSEDTWSNFRAAAGHDKQATCAQVYGVLNTVIQRQNFNTAISVISMPEVPKERRTTVTAEYMCGLRTLTGGIGPVMLTKAQADSSVITVEL